MAKADRIWELDAIRGLLILCVVLFHGLFDLRYLVLQSFDPIPVVDFLGQYGGALFVVLSGLCVTLGHRSFRRGLLVFACGMLITAVTAATTALGMTGEEIIIRFGVLHLLGICMMLWPLLQRLPTLWLGILGVILVVLGYWFGTFTVSQTWLYPLGLVAPGFASGDYFPLLPHLGWFLLGAVLGRTVYRDKVSRWPNFPKDCAVVRFFRFCGRHSLWIYLGHQPLLFGITYMIQMLR